MICDIGLYKQNRLDIRTITKLRCYDILEGGVLDNSLIVFYFLNDTVILLTP